MLSLTELLISIFIIVGVIFYIFATIGLLRLPDIYSRMHAVTKSSTLGVICILIGGFIFFIVDEGTASAKLLLGIIFIFLTAPVGAHMISRAAYLTGVSLWENSVQDDLAGRMEEIARD